MVERIAKVLGRTSIDTIDVAFRRQLPAADPVAGSVRFDFDLASRRYDWLVVYDDFPKTADGRSFAAEEIVACDPRRTMLVTSEPSRVRRYGSAFLRQFGVVLSSQEPEFIPHPWHIRAQCGLRWYYGYNPGRIITYDMMLAASVPAKTRVISTVTSSKAQRHTLHARRVAFVEALQTRLPMLDRFGHGVKLIDDKAEALDPYRYHLAIENHIAPHHWTDKLSDAFLGFTLPFYIGAPDAAEYVPAESFVPLLLDDPVGSADTIRTAIAGDWWSARREAIIEARRLILTRHGLFQTVAAWIETLEADPRFAAYAGGAPTILSSAEAKRRFPIRNVIDKVKGVARFIR